MAKELKKHHIIPVTYLKHFSISNDGKGIHVINIADKYRKDVQVKNSGDSIFWKEKYYNFVYFSNSTDLEKDFSDLENDYPATIGRIKKEVPISDDETKEYLINWIFMSIFRSPARRFWIEKVLEQQHLIARAYSEYPFLSKLPYNNEKAKSAKAKEIFLNTFSDERNLENSPNQLKISLSLKRWEILIAPSDREWITSDNPGFIGYCQNDEQVSIVTAVLDFEKADFMYYPLTKKYCLHVHPYYIDDDASLNLTNTPIIYRVAGEAETSMVNRWTYVTMHHLLIAASKNSFTLLGENLYQIQEYLSTNRPQ